MMREAVHAGGEWEIRSSLDRGIKTTLLPLMMFIPTVPPSKINFQTIFGILGSKGRA